MKQPVGICLLLLWATAAFAMQSPESADRDRCFHQYKDNPAGMHQDSICLDLADRYPSGFCDLKYLIGCSYQLDGQKEKAAEYFKQVNAVDGEYRKKAAERLSELNQPAEEE